MKKFVMILRPPIASPSPLEAGLAGAWPKSILIVDAYTPHEHGNQETHTETKDANVRDRLRPVGDVQEGMSITKAAKKLGMSQPWGSKWRARYKAEGFD